MHADHHLINVYISRQRIVAAVGVTLEMWEIVGDLSEVFFHYWMVVDLLTRHTTKHEHLGP